MLEGLRSTRQRKVLAKENKMAELPDASHLQTCRSLHHLLLQGIMKHYYLFVLLKVLQHSWTQGNLLSFCVQLFPAVSDMATNRKHASECFILLPNLWVGHTLTKSNHKPPEEGDWKYIFLLLSCDKQKNIDEQTSQSVSTEN